MEIAGFHFLPVARLATSGTSPRLYDFILALGDTETTCLPLTNRFMCIYFDCTTA